MLETLSVVNRLLGTLLGLVVVALLAAGGWIAWQSLHADRWQLEDVERKLADKEGEVAELSRELTTSRQESTRLSGALATAETEITRQAEQISTLERDLEAKRREVQQLQTAIRLLKVDHRLARIEVLGQQGSAADGNLTTRFSFVELKPDGQPMEAPRVFTVDGDVIYIDAWVVKFSDELVEAGDPLRATSVCLFRRVFGEAQQPKDGFTLDPVGARPAAYQTGDAMSQFERDLWARFWDYANDSAKAREAGVRAAHGEAPSVKLVPGKRYKVLLRASGGLTIVGEEAPADAAKAL